MLACTIRRGAQAPADGMDFSVGGNERHVVARERERRGILPGVGRRIVDLVRRDRPAGGVAAADGVNLSIQSRHADRAAPGLERSENPPSVERRIIFIRDVLPIPVHAAADKPAYGVDFPVEDSRAHVIERARKRGTWTPPVGRGVIFNVIGPGEAKHAPTHHMKLSIGSRNGNLRERGWKGSFHCPASLRLGVRNRSRQSEQRASGCARPDHSN